MHRWLRVLICLLLVCCILVNLSPLKAEATAGSVAAAVALAVGIPVAVAVGLNALGVRQGSDSTAFNNVVSSSVDALSPEWAVNGLTTMLALTTDGVTKTFANQNFLQALLDSLYANNILTTGFDYPDELINPSAFEIALSYCEQFSLCVFWVQSDGSYRFVGGSSFDIEPWSSGGFTIRHTSGLQYRYWDVTSTTGTPAKRTTNSTYIIPNSYQVYRDGVWDSITTTEDLTLESVGHDIETDYETYVDTGIVGIDFGVQFEDDPNTNRNEEDDGNDLWLPVGIPGQLSGGSYIDQTQQDAQSGNTPQDVLDELLQNSGSGDGSGDGTGSDSGSGNGSGNTWKPPSDHNVFALADLSKFFPFCIPFDLYDFFTLLNAEPVAPVLSWEIKDLAGQTYSLDVDLSQWDSVALLFRRLQLFLFITGLAAASRKFIKW